jgi:hypothetical protein
MHRVNFYKILAQDNSLTSVLTDAYRPIIAVDPFKTFLKSLYKTIKLCHIIP